MGTNFYIEVHADDFWGTAQQSIHVGKRSGIGGGATQFVWALDPTQVRSFCERFADVPVIVGDKRLTGQEFLELVERCALEDRSLIGREFA